MAWQTGAQSQPTSDKEAANIAREAMGGGGNAKPKSPRFHRMSIARAANGVTVEHTTEFPKTEKTKGAMDTPMNPNGMETKTTSHVFGDDHPVMKHMNAISQHCTGMDCPDTD